MWGNNVILEIEGKDKLDCYFQLTNNSCDFARVFAAAWKCLKELLPHIFEEELANKAIIIACNSLDNNFTWEEN